MTEEYLRSAAGIAAFILPATAVASFTAWHFARAFFPPPRADWRHGIIAFFGAWVLTVASAPLFSSTAQEFRESAPYAFIIPAVAALMAILFAPRLFRFRVVGSAIDAPVITGAPTQRSNLPTSNNRVILAGLVAGAVLLAWFYRYDVVAAGNNQVPSAYVLDRWTGQVQFCHGARCNTRDATAN